jgi:hypothetical protein
MPQWDPESGVTFGEYVRSKRPQILSGGRTWATRDQVSEGRGSDGVAFKHVVDQLGHETREHADGRRDVTINLRG